MKKCSRCGEFKPLTEFNKRCLSKDGLTSSCRECLYIENAKYRTLHREDANLRSKLWREQNPEKRKIMLHNNYIKNQEKRKSQSRQWRKDHSEQHKLNVTKWRAAHPEETKKYSKIAGARLRSTPKGKLKGSITASISHSLIEKKRGRHWEDLVGYTYEQLKIHLEKQFTPEMTWENYGTYWHIDHKVPLAVHNYEKASDIDFKRAWSLKNLRPLRAFDNLSKGAKLQEPFQPALAI
jgi:hypothetical protein